MGRASASAAAPLAAPASVGWFGWFGVSPRHMVPSAALDVSWPPLGWHGHTPPPPASPPGPPWLSPQDEKDRIEALGGFVSHMDCWRVNGTLAVSRAIGKEARGWEGARHSRCRRLRSLPSS